MGLSPAERQARYRAKRGNGFHNHGIRTDQYEELHRAQGGGCAVCGVQKPSEWKRGNLELDHCHATGEVRGLLCGDCNSSAGRVGDDPARLRALADYIENSRTALFVRGAA